MGYPHHIQSPMHGGSTIDPKFPPSTDDYHTHHHHHHNHLHHNGYGHNANTMAGNMPPLQTNNDYTNGMHHQNVPNGMHGTNNGNYNYSPTISGHFYHQPNYNSQMHHVPAPTHPSPVNNSYSPTNINGYYGSYYGSNNGHQMMDLPLQCPNTEPTNTVLGLQELGKQFDLFSILIFWQPILKGQMCG